MHEGGAKGSALRSPKVKSYKISHCFALKNFTAAHLPPRDVRGLPACGGSAEAAVASLSTACFFLIVCFTPS